MARQFNTISRGDNSILRYLQKHHKGIDLLKYVSFYCLRTYATLESAGLVTEQIYVHSKLMIVDDRVAIIGSANINDRSMKGDRDSEIAMVVENTHLQDSTMGGKPFPVGEFAHTLRCKLWEEHLGVSLEKCPYLKDPTSTASIEAWMSAAETNTKIFEELFPGEPSSHILRWSDSSKPKPQGEKRVEILKNLVGHVIHFPYRYLRHENLWENMVIGQLYNEVYD